MRVLSFTTPDLQHSIPLHREAHEQEPDAHSYSVLFSVYYCFGGFVGVLEMSRMEYGLTLAEFVEHRILHNIKNDVCVCVCVSASALTHELSN